jgi:hypothetical protein
MNSTHAFNLLLLLDGKRDVYAPQDSELIKCIQDDKIFKVTYLRGSALVHIKIILIDK